MKILRYREAGFSQAIERLTVTSSLFDAGIESRTREILEQVRAEGDAALVALTARFDGAKLTAAELGVTQAEYLTASIRVEPRLREALSAAAANLERFSRRSLRKAWAMRNREGASVGEKFDPFQRVGLYVPGGTAPLISTALMTIVLARVAGCPEIVVCTPCGRDGRVHPGLLYAARLAGATEVYRLGGAQAMAAMAFGTATVRPVQKIFGPGNAYVVAAKRLLFGYVAVDLLPGPSEVLVLADDTANARWVAADLLAQAEHGSGSERVWLVTPSARLVKAVAREIERQLPPLDRRAFIERALEAHGYLIQVASMDAAVEVANRLAPEHCEIHARGARALAAKITTAGAIFLGGWSPTVLGDYLAGPSHTLPTGGAGRSFAGLTVDQFQRRTSVVEYDRTALKRSMATLNVFAECEGLSAHGRSAAIRLER